MMWSDAYVGIPYTALGRDRRGCDCWGLARLIYAQELKVALPSHAGDYSDDFQPGEIEALLKGRHLAPWVSVDEVEIAPFDLLLFRLGRSETHIGIAIDPIRMLHLARDDHAKIECRTDPRWKSRFVGAYRHTGVSVPVPLARAS